MGILARALMCVFQNLQLSRCVATAVWLSVTTFCARDPLLISQPYKDLGFYPMICVFVSIDEQIDS